MTTRFTMLLLTVGAVGAVCLALAQPEAPSPIRFAYQPIDFTLDSSETPERHAPETMAGGVAVFEANNDGHLDIFFTNGANIHTLRKTASKYRNRLFLNDGYDHFTDATEKAGLAGTGFDVGVAVGDYDNDGFEDIFVGGVYRNTLYHNNGDGTFTDVTEQAGLASKPDPEFGPLGPPRGRRSWIRSLSHTSRGTVISPRPGGTSTRKHKLSSKPSNEHEMLRVGTNLGT